MAMGKQQESTYPDADKLDRGVVDICFLGVFLVLLLLARRSDSRIVCLLRFLQHELARSEKPLGDF